MRITQLDTENADRDLTSLVAVLTHTPSASLHTWCQAVVKLGDGTKDIDTAESTLTILVTVGGQTVVPSQVITKQSGVTRAVFVTIPFMVPANHAVVISVQSSDADDDDVDVTAYLFDVGTVDVVALNGVAQVATYTPQINAELTGTPTTTSLQFSGSGLSADLNLVGRKLFIATGDCAGEETTILNTSESGGTWTLTVAALSTAPAASDAIVILTSDDDEAYVLRGVIANSGTRDSNEFDVTANPAVDVDTDFPNDMQCYIRLADGNVARRRVLDVANVSGTVFHVTLATALPSTPAVGTSVKLV